MTWGGIIAFAAGVAVGLLAAKAYAQNEIKGDISNVLNKVDLGGGTVETVADKLLVPQ